mmetsp:Transcript_93223/g.200035  ORF Transcript_93223/g.200035 Transcript_93223/m.200035 type:complete len:216 (-) Transcript_93223:621-1268(-)
MRQCGYVTVSPWLDSGTGHLATSPPEREVCSDRTGAWPGKPEAAHAWGPARKPACVGCRERYLEASGTSRPPPLPSHATPMSWRSGKFARGRRRAPAPPPAPPPGSGPARAFSRRHRGPPCLPVAHAAPQGHLPAPATGGGYVEKSHAVGAWQRCTESGRPSTPATGSSPSNRNRGPGKAAFQQHAKRRDTPGQRRCRLLQPRGWLGPAAQASGS